MRKILLLCVLLGCSLWQAVEAQERKITGTVMDASSNEPLPGVTVRVTGTTKGAVTNIQGHYAISVEAPATLVFSFVGYISQEVQAGNRSVIDISLVEDIEQLQEVVVVGYGTQEKKDATGAVESIKSKDFNQGVISSPEELIQGKSAGVQITTASGEPGGGVNIRIRGTSSVRGGNNPLFVVDGVPLAGDEVSSMGQDLGRGASSAKNPLNFLNPNDIESIDILKDASATAIYGSRGANGVVIITTKSGKGQKQTLDYGSQVSFSSPANKLDLLDRQQFLSAINELGGDTEALDKRGNTNWQDVVLRNSVSHKHDLSYGNSYKTGDYRVSLGYQNQEGIVRNSAMERYTARVNWNQGFFNERLKLGIQSTFSRLNDEQPPITNNAGFEGDLIGTMYMANPTWPADPTKQFDNAVANPASFLEYYLDKTKTNRQLINASLAYEIGRGLNFKVNSGFDNSTSDRGQIYSPELALGNGIFENGRGALMEVEANNKLLETLLTYDKKYANSKLSALAGYSYQQFNREGSTVLGWGFAGNNMDAMVNDLQSSAASIRNVLSGPYQQFYLDQDGLYLNALFPNVRDGEQINGEPGVAVKSVAEDVFKQQDEIQSFFGRVNYNLMDKYLFTGTFRADGSTKFGKNNKYGYFPSASFAWRLSEEDFIGDFFYDLKLRTGYGITGNQEIPHNQHQARQRYRGISIENGGNINNPGLANVAFENHDLSWEQTSQMNLGLDFALNKGRFSGSMDVYKKVTSDLLMRVNSAQPAAQDWIFWNLDAEVVNQGAEMILNYVAIDGNKFGLDFSVNGAYNHNEVQNFDGIVDTGEISGQGLSGAFAQRIADGQPLFAYFLRDFKGINSKGLSEYAVDVQQFVGKSPLPKYNLGFGAQARYGRFDLSTYFYGQFGHYIYNNTANAFFTLGALSNGRNITVDAYEETKSSGESRANAPDASTRFLEKGDFFRMQNLNLGYNAPIGGEGFVKRLRVYASAQNLFVLTRYSGSDPEVNTNKAMNDVPSSGIDYTAYPRARTFTVGLNATF